MQTFHTLVRALRRRPLTALRAEGGSMLIEVMVGALILAITTTAVLNGLDGAQKTGGRNKARTVAATLAEQDQERMRGMPVTSIGSVPDLIDYIATPYTRTVTVRGADYTITSSAAWATDNVSASCTSSAKTSANLRIVSAVTSPLTRGTVDQASLVTPPPGSYGPNQGTVAVQVRDRSSVAIPSATVNLSGTSSQSATTNSAGCAVFPFIPVGGYTATVTFPTLVKWNGQSPPTGNTSASQGTVTLLSLELDRPATINVNFNTVVNGTTITGATVRSEWATVNNGKLDPPFTKSFQAIPAGTPNQLVAATGLFPFLDGYRVWAGQCTTNRPTTLPNTGTEVISTPLPAGSATAVVRVPSINVHVVNVAAAAAGVSGARVFIKTADGCTTTYPFQASIDTTAGGVAALPQPGFPYGSYKLCAQQTATSGPHGHADVRTGTSPGVYDPLSTGTTPVPAETPANRVDDTVLNINPNGNTTNANALGAIRIRLNRSGQCE